MRSAVMILALLLVLGGVFFFVALRDRPPMLATTQSTSRPTSRAIVPSTIATLHPEASMIGQSNGVWMQTLDRRPGHVGRLAKEFKFERLDPRKDDAVDVTQPRARFYNDDGSIITLDGTDGVVLYSQGGDRSDPKSIGNATPDNGVFRNVTIRIFDTPAATSPSTTATLPAVRFDSNDNRIATVDSVIDGRGVLADQVPVKVRGDDYEFDGRGLTMRWNDRDGRLEDLVIAHGERLLIRDISSFNSDGGAIVTTPKPATQAAPVTMPAFGPADLLDGLLMAQPTTEKVSKASQRRAAARAAVAAAAATRPTTRRVKEQPLYYARFERDVRVFRSGVQIATADTMNVTLPSDRRRPEPAADAAPVDAPTVPAPGRSEKRDRSTTTRSAHRPASPSTPADTPASPNATATTRPAEPLEIFWTGPLTVRPATAETTPAGGGKMVEFVGSPAHVTQGLSTIDARLIHVEPDAGLARVEPGGVVKTISLRLGETTQVRSGSPLLVDREAGLATIEGAGTMATTDAASTRPTTHPTTKPTTARGPTTVTWGRRMVLRLDDFGDDPGGPQWLDEIELQGDATIDSDSFAMNGDTLTFDFDEPDVVPTKGSNDALLATPDAKFLRFASAEGHARVEAGEVDDRHTLIGEEIRLGLIERDDAAALTSIIAEHGVAVLDARGSELYCDHLDVGVEPIALATATTRATTRPSVATRPADGDAFALVDRLSATGGVRVRQADGSNASGDALTLAALDGRKTVALTGAPAIAGSPRATLSSARLVLDPATNDVDVPGAGTLVSADPAKPGQIGVVTWTDSMSFDNAAAKVAIRGGVTIDNREATGATLRATSDRATLLLAASATTRPTTRPTTAPSFDSIRSALLDGNVEINVDNAEYRHANVQTVALSIDVEHNLVTANHPGRMLMFDQRNDPATRPTTDPTTAPTTLPATLPTSQAVTQPTTAPASQPTSRPTTRPARSSSAPTLLAVEWRDKLRWELLPGTLQMTGGVVVGYERGTPGERMKIRSRRLDATLAPIDLRTATTKPTTRATTGPATRAAEPQFELRSVHARDDVYVTSPRANFNAAVLDYDLSSDLAYASGDADRNVSVFDATGASRVGFSRITWNVQTGAITDFRDISGQIRR